MTLRSVTGKRCVVSLVAVAFAAACATDLTSFANRYTTPAERAFPRLYLQLLADAHLDSALSLLAPELRTDTARSAMLKIATLLKDAHLDSMRLIGVNVSSFGAGNRDVNLTYEMPTSIAGSWVTSNVATRRAGPTVAVAGAPVLVNVMLVTLSPLTNCPAPVVNSVPVKVNVTP